MCNEESLIKSLILKGRIYMFLSKGYKGYYYLYYKDETGKRRKISTKTKLKSEANKFFRKFNSAKKPDEPIKKVQLRISEVEIPIMKYVVSNFTKSTQEKYSLTFRNLKRILNDIPVQSVTINEIEYYKSVRVKEVNPVSCNIEIRNIRAICNLSIKLGLMDGHSLKGIQQFKIPQKEYLSFTDSEVELIIKNIEDKTLKWIVLIGLMTGCRLDEICNIQFGDINLKDRILRIRNKPNFKTKTGRIRNIPISNDLYSLIESIIKTDDNIIALYTDDDYLFRNKRNVKFNKDYISRSFKKVLRKLNMAEKYHFHCLRHTFITKLIKNGVPINYVKELAGHSQIETTLGYVHIVTDDLRKAVDSITFN